MQPAQAEGGGSSSNALKKWGPIGAIVLVIAAVAGIVLVTSGDDDDGDDAAVDTTTAVTTGVSATIHGLYGDLVLNADGSYSYVADQLAANALAEGVCGTDTFTYTITDASGDSASATVSLTVGESMATRTLDLSTSKSRGNNIVTLTWTGFTGNVSISRNGVQLANSEPSEGTWQDNLGKGTSGTYDYLVCDTECENATITF